MTSYYFGKEVGNSKFLRPDKDPVVIKLPRIEGASISKLSKRSKTIAPFLFVRDEDWLIIKPLKKRFKRNTVIVRAFEDHELDDYIPSNAHLS